jgi:hypothetical protein
VGSSLGGHVSLRAAIDHASTFGLVGAMSPAVPGGQGPILARLRRLQLTPERVYLDVGGRQGSHIEDPRLRRQWTPGFPRNARRIRAALLAAGLREPTDLRLVEEPDGIHHESAWARRLPDALRFLFGPTEPANPGRGTIKVIGRPEEQRWTRRQRRPRSPSRTSRRAAAKRSSGLCRFFRFGSQAELTNVD